MSDSTLNFPKVWSASVAQEEGISVYRRYMKRLLDIVLAILLLPIIAPIVALLYVLVRLDGGPGFFGHTRVGYGDKEFPCWKLRSMAVDAGAQLEKLLATDPEARAEWERDRKLRNDPRITRLGAILRKTSLDELPQIWNVLKGEMSFVGPRPVPRDELLRYGGSSWAYLALRPGITGLWQVSGRNDVSYEERVEMDKQYLSRVSFVFDTLIIAKTTKAILGKTGV